MRVIRSEPGQHVRMNFAVEVVHQERAEDRDVMLLGELIEQVFEVHAGGDVPALPQDIDHFSPPSHFWVAPSSARLSDDVRGEAEEYRRIRHGVPHEAGQEFVGVNHRQLSTVPCRFHVHALGLEAWANGVPVGERWHQDDALSVRESSTGEPADGAVEKILVLIELHDVIAWGGVRHHSIPGLTFAHAVHLTFKLTVHGNCLRSESFRQPRSRVTSSSGDSTAASTSIGRRVAHGLLRSPLPQFWDELLRRDEERIALEDAADDDRRVRPHSAAVSIPAAATRRNWSSRWSGFTTRIALSPRSTPPRTDGSS